MLDLTTAEARERANEAVAVALGWVAVAPRGWWSAAKQRFLDSAPDYLADDAGLNREMEDALFASGSRGVGVWRAPEPVAGGPRYAWEIHTDPRLTPANVYGATKAEALVRALHAAGVVALPDAVERPQPAEAGD